MEGNSRHLEKRRFEGVKAISLSFSRALKSSEGRRQKRAISGKPEGNVDGRGYLTPGYSVTFTVFVS